MEKKKVSLVLASGGARGYAHVGAIQELEAQGYEIVSVAGASMGSLVGGMYAAGKLNEVAEWMKEQKPLQILSLADFTLSWNHLVKGDKVMDALKELVPDTNIEDLPITYRAVATDVRNYREVVFEKGSLYQAIRSSISIPAFFKPVNYEDDVLIDGGVVNPLPLNRVVRQEGDILVAVSINAPSERAIDEERVQQKVGKEVQIAQRSVERIDNWMSNMIENKLPEVTSEVGGKIQPWLQNVKDIGREFVEKAITNAEESMLKSQEAKNRTERNYFTLLVKTFTMMIEQNSKLMLQQVPPDILVNMPTNRYGAFDWEKAEEIIEYGRLKMREALAAYEQTI